MERQHPIVAQEGFALENDDKRQQKEREGDYPEKRCGGDIRRNKGRDGDKQRTWHESEGRPCRSIAPTGDGGFVVSRLKNGGGWRNATDKACCNGHSYNQ
ncbi:hypothetical protein MAE02_35040 [Microvirga aerophila]|uniref:Uncharacterized protein n=1 Tax=Microvirga aerophila TaxID=670291 RepID=A0A512BV20_9HYPH|nr:hypothetical protein MAE02_35040 [Microvirga aerophila]